ncbi:unnamed protein product [Pleuronectes platessa]|uniref:Uncharacterized protein n=1 Tax=Pleuronectes platessa TaxID=8262 RepID=A0A9N7V8Z6_PLEPL|nr:unnamed protein product [Pleuronectes platessa]
MTENIQRDGKSSGRFHHASRCPQLKSSVGWPAKRQVFKYLMSMGGVHTRLPVTQRKVPFCGEAEGGRDPHVAPREGRGFIQLLFEFRRVKRRRQARKWNSLSVQSNQKYSAYTYCHLKHSTPSACPTALSFGDSGEIINGAMMLITTERPRCFAAPGVWEPFSERVEKAGNGERKRSMLGRV